MKPIRIIGSAGLGAVLGAVLITGIAAAEPREGRIASHVSGVSPLHAQSQLFAAEIDKHLP
ncbi:MAG: hypothetical protein AAF501_15570, partial [Pseudomonadota bacterium]